MKPVIEVTNVSKKYRLGEGVKYLTLRDSLSNLVGSPWGFLTGGERETFFALKEVSFVVEPGEVLGVIGANGAGKSTLLKVLSRITPPTSGEIYLRGRVASLLEVGTGFHQELTGRENIFLNGAILGMKQREISRKFDQVVAFSGIERFLDTPIKHYSSGMYVRLAFSVVAYLDADILLVDEVLAVGDVEFQKKSLGKMEGMIQEGRTVIFVSHNMDAVQRLCGRLLVLDQGKVIYFSDDVVGGISRYLQLEGARNKLGLKNSLVSRRGNGLARFIEILPIDRKGSRLSEVKENQPFEILLSVKAERALDLAVLSVTFVDQASRDLLTSFISDSLKVSRLEMGVHTFKLKVDPNILLPGVYMVRLACLGPALVEYDHIASAFHLRVVSDSSRVAVPAPRPGLVSIPLVWKKL